MANHTHYNPFWHDVLSGRIRKRVWRRRLFRLISPGAHERCHLCLAPFDGISAPLMRAIGRGPWRRNPHYCDKCELLFTGCRGGAEVELAVVYADVRGSTQLAAQMRPIEFAALMERFFIAATKILTAGGAAIDKMVGDEVVALYLPGLIGGRRNYRRKATHAGIELLRATGHADESGPWLPIGVSVHSGVAFVGYQALVSPPGSEILPRLSKQISNGIASTLAFLCEQRSGIEADASPYGCSPAPTFKPRKTGYTLPINGRRELG